MVEQNPLQLQVITAPAAQGNKNPKGRPRRHESVIFSKQPRSIVSQMIEKMVTEKKIVLPIVWNSEGNTTSSTPIEEDTDQRSERVASDHSPTLIEDVVSSKPKEQSSSKSKVKKPKIYFCDFFNCIYRSKLSSNLQKHRRTHTGEKPFLCDRCSFRTNFSNSLKVHKRLHTAERPYQCTDCDYRCNSISNLKKHCHTKHKNNTNLNGTKLLTSK